MMPCAIHGAERIRQKEIQKLMAKYLKTDENKNENAQEGKPAQEEKPAIKIRKFAKL